MIENTGYSADQHNRGSQPTDMTHKNCGGAIREEYPGLEFYCIKCDWYGGVEALTYAVKEEG